MSEFEREPGPRTLVSLVNDHEVILRGIEAMLRPFKDRIDVVELDVERNPDQFVDVALFDPYGHPQLGLDRIRDLAEDPHVGAVLLYSWSFAAERVDAALAAGARGVLAKSMSAEDLVDAIRLVADGREVVSTSFGRAARQPWPGYDLGLTLRESEVAAFLGQGLRNRDIAGALWVSENTVKTHLKSIFQKLSVRSRAEAIVRISRDGSFDPTKRSARRAAPEKVSR